MVMTSLSLDSINSIAPYQVTQSDKPFLFKFVSDFGIENFAALIIRKDNPDFAHIVTEFTELTNLVNQPKPKS